MFSKFNIPEQSLLEQYELCPHNLRARVITKYCREPPILLDDEIRIERLGNKPLSKSSKFCLWSNMNFFEKYPTKYYPERKNFEYGMNTGKNNPIRQTIFQKIRENFTSKKIKPKIVKGGDVSEKDSLNWILRPKKIIDSTTSLSEYMQKFDKNISTKTQATYVKRNTKNNNKPLTTCVQIYAINENSTGSQNKSVFNEERTQLAGNYKLKQKPSITTLAQQQNKQPFWKHDIMKHLIPKGTCMGKKSEISSWQVNSQDKTQTNNLTEIINFDNQDISEYPKKASTQSSGGNNYNNAPQATNSTSLLPKYPTNHMDNTDNDIIIINDFKFSKPKMQITAENKLQKVQIGLGKQSVRNISKMSRISKTSGSSGGKKTIEKSCHITQNEIISENKINETLNSQAQSNNEVDDDLKTKNIFNNEICQISYHIPVRVQSQPRTEKKKRIHKIKRISKKSNKCA